MHTMDEAIDRTVELRRRRWRRGTIALAILLLLGFSVGRLRRGALAVSRDDLRLGRVVEAPFREAIMIQGTLEPMELVYLETAYGGRVEEVNLREGSRVREGDFVLRLGNTDLELETMRQNDLL